MAITQHDQEGLLGFACLGYELCYDGAAELIKRAKNNNGKKRPGMEPKDSTSSLKFADNARISQSDKCTSGSLGPRRIDGRWIKAGSQAITIIDWLPRDASE